MCILQSIFFLHIAIFNPLIFVQICLIINIICKKNPVHLHEMVIN